MINAATAATLLTTAGSAATDNLAKMAYSGKVGDMSKDQIDKVSKDFESMFLSQMVDQMFGDSEGDSAFGDSETNQIYKSMMVDEYGKQITNAGGIGIADYVKQELLKLQEK